MVSIWSTIVSLSTSDTAEFGSGTSHCSTWAQAAEKELWEIFEMLEISRGVLRQGFWVAQGFTRENEGVWGEKHWGCSDQCHSLGESGHSSSHRMNSITARWQFSNTWIWPIPCRCPQDQQRLCMCHMEELSSAWQLVKSYLSFMCVSPELIALHF